jgi:glutamyl-Q tRNA(Asp) synthetase
MPPPVFRFAPSPTGYLHLGHALSALLNFDAAKRAGGRFLLRIEDIDSTRCRPEYEAAIYEDLEWLGLTWEGPVRRQSEHFGEYRNVLQQLGRDGLLYRAYETRAELNARIVERDPDGGPRYRRGSGLSADEQAARIEAGEPYALRLDLDAALARVGTALSWNEHGDGDAREIIADPTRWGDVVLGRKETPSSYHLAVVLDDAAQGVTDVLRGRDLYEATAVHVLLQLLLGLPAPRYAHHRLLLNADGRKLAKRERSTTLRDLRADGVTLEEIKRRTGL